MEFIYHLLTKELILNKQIINKNFTIIGSAHNQVEIKKKIEQGCEAIFLSPLFRIAKNKKIFRCL